MASEVKLTVWAGFSAGELAFFVVNDMFGGGNFRRTPAIFLTRSEARNQFADVRRIEIREVNEPLHRHPRAALKKGNE